MVTTADTLSQLQSDAGSDFNQQGVWVVIVAGGSGHRFGSLKQFEVLGEQRIIDVSLDTAQANADGVVPLDKGTVAGMRNALAGELERALGGAAPQLLTPRGPGGRPGRPRAAAARGPDALDALLERAAERDEEEDES